MSEKLLEIQDEHLSFFTPAGEVKALNGVSFSMEEGDVLGIVGESGSGKSVTAYSIMGLNAHPGRLAGHCIHWTKFSLLSRSCCSMFRYQNAEINENAPRIASTAF